MINHAPIAVVMSLPIIFSAWIFFLFIVISHPATEVRHLGYNEGFPWYEPFGEVSRIKDLEMFADWINRLGPRYLVFDNPASALSVAVPNRRDHMLAIIEKATTYRLARSEGAASY